MKKKKLKKRIKRLENAILRLIDYKDVNDLNIERIATALSIHEARLNAKETHH